MKDETTNAILRLPYVMVTTHDYLHYLKLMEEENISKPLTLEKEHYLDEPLNVEPFHTTDFQMRLLAMRRHLLTSLDFVEGRKGWVRDKDFINNDTVLRSSDNEFMDKVEELNPTIDFRLK